MKRLRVAFVAGTLARGGAEKQLVHMAAELARAGVDVRVYALTRDDDNGRALAALGHAPVWIGRLAAPPARLAALAAGLATFRPHIVQAGHFFTNLYAAAGAPVCGAAGIGAIRSDVRYELGGHGVWGRPLLAAPADLIANSWAGKQAAERAGRAPSTVHVVPNVIDLAAFEHAGGMPAPWPGAGPVAIAVGNLLPVKRIDRFLAALRLARLRSPDLRGVVVGDGPERQRLEATAAELGLLPDGIAFLGSRDDVPGLLRQADMLVLSSEHEGFPNAVLEAMGARLPVVATPCGDVERIVADGVTGFVVPPDDAEGMAERMSALAGSLELRRRLGDAGRAVAERTYASWRLAGRLQETYQAIAERRRRARLAAALA